MNFWFFIKLAVLLSVGLAITFVVEPLDPTTVSTPFCLSIILMALSLRRSATLVAITSFFYCVLTIYALVHFMEFSRANFYNFPHPYFWLFQRAGLFLVVSAMAIYLAIYRKDTQQILTHIQDILSKLPAPVVISDAAGYIVYVNDALSTVFKQDAAEFMGKRYVELFMTDIQEGKAMRYYIELFEAQGNGIHELVIKPPDGPAKMNGRLTCFGIGSKRVMITVLSDSKSALRA